MLTDLVKFDKIYITQGVEMKNLLILFFLLILIGCETRMAEKKRHAKENPDLVFTRINLGKSVYRLENSEVICYYEYDGGMDCKFKGENNASRN